MACFNAACGLPYSTVCMCVLQVHAAVLAGSQKEVVIKVLRPGTEDVLLTDLNFVSLPQLLNCDVC